MRKVTCYAWGKPGDWEAICVDLDIAAQGASFEQARSELGDAVETFLDYIADLPEIEQAVMLKRKAPLSLRIRLELLSRAYALRALLKRRTGSSGHNLTVFVMTPSS